MGNGQPALARLRTTVNRADARPVAIERQSVTDWSKDFRLRRPVRPSGVEGAGVIDFHFQRPEFNFEADL